MPSSRPWEKYGSWCMAYKSDIVFLDLPMQPILVVGSAKAAMELLEKRAGIWSDRVPSIIIELMNWDFNLALIPYGNKWRIHRRMFHQEFHTSIVKKYWPVQLDYARMFLSLILKSPADTRKHVRQMITGLIFYITYGKRVSGMNDEAVVVAQIALEGLSKGAVPGFSWLDYFPLARHIPSWFPGTSSRKLAEKYLPYVRDMKDKPYDEVKANLDKGIAPPSLAASLIEKNRKYSGTDEEGVYDEASRNVAGLAYAAGADTTNSSCESFLLAMALFPEVQKRAQAELDRVVGPHRLPDFDDFDNLPYIRAMVMETSRWLPDVWGILHNPEDYPEPERFWPDRFIGADGEIDPTVRDPTTIAFGFGRRLCVGRPFSNNTLAIFIASILHVFDISAGVDDSGKPVELSAEYIGGLIAGPRDVPTGLKPRSEAAKALISNFRMSSLAADSASFKKGLNRADYSSWHAQPPPLQPQASGSEATNGESSKKKKRSKQSMYVVYSQPADTGTGQNLNTQLLYAVTHLKSTGNPVRLQDLAIITSTPLDTDKTLLERFKAHDRVLHDPKTDLYSYRHDFNVRNKAALLTEIQRQTRNGGGLSVRTLKESWKEAPQAIEELEKEGDVFVTRTTKDGQLRMVFWNEIKPDEENGGKQVEKEFLDLWHSLEVPNDVDLLKSLANEGLQATAAESLAPKGPFGKKKGKKSAPRQRQVRITNVHLKGQIDLSKDYVAPGK
ncbi:hypothetical protein EUX98_g930 [Antrodiella citrinella]|uniref:TFIIE beta domain-containing protein n=1 Tax=Antrodiella citrinella TaxID=2447956 RepID=A0A4S4N2T5_9APHY|nr:hypothetical protein EUX98_g930 [Antrodiella citrinella]